MRWVLVVVCALLPMCIAAKPDGAVWRGGAVQVRVYTTPEWHTWIMQGVADMNVALPPSAPLLKVRIMGERGCGAVRKRNEHKKRTITICSRADGPHDHLTRLDTKRDTITGTVNIVLSGMPETHWVLVYQNANTICHELMHAVADAPENVGSASCVNDGLLTAPGVDDIAFVNRVYRRHR